MKFTAFSPPPHFGVSALIPWDAKKMGPVLEPPAKHSPSHTRTLILGITPSPALLTASSHAHGGGAERGISLETFDVCDVNFVLFLCAFSSVCYPPMVFFPGGFTNTSQVNESCPTFIQCHKTLIQINSPPKCRVMVKVSKKSFSPLWQLK